MLEVNDIHVSYGKVEAVRGVSLTVKPGKVTLVLGANGAGKSTTLKAVAGLEKPTSGTIVLDEKPITWLPPHAIVRRHGQHVEPGARSTCLVETHDERACVGAPPVG